MTLYLKKQVYIHGNNYEVFNEEDAVVYTAKGDIHSQQVRLTLYDLRGRELVYLQEEKTKSKPTFEISINGSIYAVLSKEQTWKNKTYTVDSKNGNFSVTQDFSGSDYTIAFNGSPFGTIKKDQSSWRDAHVLVLDTEENVEFFVAMLLGISNINDHEEEFGMN